MPSPIACSIRSSRARDRRRARRSRAGSSATRPSRRAKASASASTPARRNAATARARWNACVTTSARPSPCARMIARAPGRVLPRRQRRGLDEHALRRHAQLDRAPLHQLGLVAPGHQHPRRARPRATPPRRPARARPARAPRSPSGPSAAPSTTMTSWLARAHLPMQKRAKIASSTSASTVSPVTRPIASSARRASTAASSLGSPAASSRGRALERRGAVVERLRLSLADHRHALFDVARRARARSPRRAPARLRPSSRRSRPRSPSAGRSCAPPHVALVPRDQLRAPAIAAHARRSTSPKPAPPSTTSTTEIGPRRARDARARARAVLQLAAGILRARRPCRPACTADAVERRPPPRPHRASCPAPRRRCARSCPTSALNRLDLPAFTRPTSATSAGRNSAGR